MLFSADSVNRKRFRIQVNPHLDESIDAKETVDRFRRSIETWGDGGASYVGATNRGNSRAWEYRSTGC